MATKGNLVIVESPTKARKIQGFLGDDYLVKYSKGHIRDLQENSLSIDIDNNFAPNYVIPSDKTQLVSELQKDVKQAESVLLASDEDREGEAIAWHLSEVLQLDPAKTKRIVFHEITKNAILDAVEHPRVIDMNLVKAQQARRVLDRLVGFELSPVLWKKIQPKLSAGRVQSVALRLIVDREREILAFRNKAYYKVEGVFIPEGSNIKVKAVLDSTFDSKDEAHAFLERCIGASYTVTDIKSKEGTRTSAPPFTTSSLQQEAARKLHFSVKQTMQIAQKLYEEGLITYMRTDSVNLSKEAIGASKQYILDNYGEQYSRPRQYQTKAKGAQEAHEAIRPTYIQNSDISGSPAEKRLYQLIWKRTVASQMADARVLNTTVDIRSDKVKEKFKAEAMHILFDGFLKLYRESTDDGSDDSQEAILPDIATGSSMKDEQITAEAKFTAPPLRYSQASLVKKLEELQIGRPSTYESTINTLMRERGYIQEGDKEGTVYEVTNFKLKGGSISSGEKKEKVGAESRKLLPRDIGMMVSDFLSEHFPSIMDYGFTAGVESDFDLIAEGGKQWDKVISDFYTPFHQTVVTAIKDSGYSHLEREIGIDPSDGKKIIAKYGQYGPYVQKGEGDDKVCVSLGKGQIIESLSIEEATRLFLLPRHLGVYNDAEMVVMKGRFGAYIKYGDKNISLPKTADPLSITTAEAIAVIDENSSKTASKVLAQWGDIQVIEGMYGPYIKNGSDNYKIPRGTDIASLTETAVKELIAGSEPTTRKKKTFRK